MSSFVPTYSLISAITQMQNATVTFTANHDFLPGEIVSFRVSKPYGMVEINNQQATISSITSNTITVPIDTTYYTPFIYPPSTNPQYLAVVVPSASGIIPGLYPPTVNLEDNFDNVPPN